MSLVNNTVIVYNVEQEFKVVTNPNNTLFVNGILRQPGFIKKQPWYKRLFKWLI